jgi:hypothetical protein
MKRTIWLAGVGAVLAIGASALASPAHAATNSVHVTNSTKELLNWSGYYKATSAPIGQADVTFTVPTVNCKNSRGPAPVINSKPLYAGSMWVGIGGQNNVGILTSEPGYAWLEQTGVSVECAGLNAKPLYQPFYEVVPTAKFPSKQFSTGQEIYGKGSATVQAGDQIYAEVLTPAYSTDPGKWQFAVYDYRGGVLSSKWQESLTLPKGTYSGKPGLLSALDQETVEVVTECPATNKGLTGFVNLGTVNYSYADYTVTNTELGYSIASKPIDLVHGSPRATLAVYPGKPSASPGSDILSDAFSTLYASNWWR